MEGVVVSDIVISSSLHAYHPRLKQLFLSEEIVNQMRWHKEGKRDSEYFNIMLLPADG
jgi:hypothetical protein